MIIFGGVFVSDGINGAKVHLHVQGQDKRYLPFVVGYRTNQ